MMEIFTCEQNSPDWYRCRLGLPTASEFSTVLAKGKDGGASIGRARYMRTLAGELITGEPAESYTNPYMERGKIMEEDARSTYAFIHDAEPELIGFIRNGPKGCSPDALIGDSGMLELKTKKAELLIELLIKDQFPPEHKAQTQGALWVAEREWIDLACYWPGLPLFVRRAYRDEPYIATLAGAVDRFNEELAEMVERVRRYGTNPSLTETLQKSLELVSTK